MWRGVSLGGRLMSEHTLESLARRVEALERALGVSPPEPRKWEQAVGMFANSETMPLVDEEGRMIREAAREEARRESEG
jgi:hypothetical protein